MVLKGEEGWGLGEEAGCGLGQVGSEGGGEDCEECGWLVNMAKMRHDKYYRSHVFGMKLVDERY